MSYYQCSIQDARNYCSNFLGGMRQSCESQLPKIENNAHTFLNECLKNVAPGGIWYEGASTPNKAVTSGGTNNAAEKSPPLAAGPTCVHAQAQLRTEQARVSRDEMAIRNMGSRFQTTAADIAEWQSLATEARAQFMSDTFDGLLSFATKLNKWGGSLSPPSASKAISTLRAAHIENAALNNAIRALAATSGKPVLATGVKEFLGSVGNVKAGISVAMAHDFQSRLKALSDVLTIVLGALDSTQTLSLLTADLTFAASSIYNNAARRVSIARIDQLATLTERDLNSLKVFSQQLRADVDKVNVAKGQIAASCKPKP